MIAHLSCRAHGVAPLKRFKNQPMLLVRLKNSIAGLESLPDFRQVLHDGVQRSRENAIVGQLGQSRVEVEIVLTPCVEIFQIVCRAIEVFLQTAKLLVSGTFGNKSS